MSFPPVPGTPTVTVREWAIGPSHDPYSAWEITLSLQDGTKGMFYSDGLGRRSVEFFSDYDDEPVRSFEWYDGARPEEMRRSKLLLLKANLLAKRIVGKRFDEAEQKWEEQQSAIQEDPMGPASRYI